VEPGGARWWKPAPPPNIKREDETMIEHLDDFIGEIRRLQAEFYAACVNFQPCDMDFLGDWAETDATLKLHDAFAEYLSVLGKVKEDS
jgi:hypothetical protein